MTIQDSISTIASYIRGQGHDVDPDTEAAIANYHTVKAEGDALEAKLTKLLADVEQKERLLAKAATESQRSGDTKAYRAAKKECDAATETLDIARLALGDTRQRLADATAEVRSRGLAGRIKVQRKFNTMRSKATADLTAAIGSYVASYQKLDQINDKIFASWPQAIAGTLPGGGLVERRELHEVVLRELNRVAPFDPMRPSDIPGVSYSPLQGDPRKFRSLANEIELSNALLVDRIAQEPAPRAPTVSPVANGHAEPAEPEPQTIDARAIMPKRRILLDDSARYQAKVQPVTQE